MSRNVALMKGAIAGAVWLWLVSTALGAGPDARKTTCATCHRDEALSFPKAAMGIGIELAPEQKLLRAHPKLAVEENGYSYQIERKGDVSTYTVKDATGALSLPIRYAFGVRNQTFVFEYQGHYYESMVSYYEAIDGLAVTIGRESLRPTNLVEAIGRLTPDAEIAACFNCHSTGGVTGGKVTPETLKPGVSCERCHAGSGAHMQSFAGGRPAPAPKKLGQMGAEEMSEFCGACHHTWASVVEERQFGVKNVRFQPYRLANSKCFLGADKRVRCTACHNPHHELVEDAASYDKVCLSCHTSQKACPVADAKCVTCHMPKVQAPVSGFTFHDHYIRVVHAGEAYPN